MSERERESVCVCVCENGSVSYQCLHHKHSLGPHLAEELIDIHSVLHVKSLQHRVQEYEGASTPHPCTAVDHHRGTSLLVSLADMTYEVDERGGVLGHTMIGPAQVEPVSYLQRSTIRFVTLQTYIINTGLSLSLSLPL